MSKKPDKLPILKDTREPKDIYLWRGDKWRDKAEMKLATLNVGDFTIPPWGVDCIFVERKKIDDYVASITRERERFRRMLERANPDAEKWVMLEGENALIRLFNAEYRSHCRERSVQATLLSWVREFGCFFFEVPNSTVGMDAIAWILYDFRRRKRLEEKASGTEQERTE